MDEPPLNEAWDLSVPIGRRLAIAATVIVISTIYRYQGEIDTFASAFAQLGMRRVMRSPSLSDEDADAIVRRIMVGEPVGGRLTLGRIARTIARTADAPNIWQRLRASRLTI